MKSSWLGRILVCSAVILGATLLVVAPRSHVARAASIQLNPASAPVGTQVSVVGSGFAPGSPPCQVRFGINGSAPFPSWGGSVVANCTVSQQGSLTATFSVPPTPLGTVTIGVCNYCNGGEFVETTTASFTVTAPPTTVPTTTSPPPQSSTTIPATTSTSTSAPPTTSPTAGIPPVVLDMPALVDGAGIPDLGPLLGDAGPWRPIAVEDGAIDIPERWLERCATPPDARVADFDDRRLGSNDSQISRRDDPRPRTFMVAGLEHDHSVVAPLHGTWSAPHAISIRLPDARYGSDTSGGSPRVPYQSFVARDGYDSIGFTYFGLRVGLADDVAGPVMVQLSGVGEGYRSVVKDVDRLYVGPGRSPATSCMIVLAPPGSKLDEVRLSVVSSDRSEVNLLFDGVFWSHDSAFPLDDNLSNIPIEITMPAEGERLSTDVVTTVVGRVTWPAGSETPRVGVMIPTWNRSGLLFRGAILGEPVSDGIDASAIFSVNSVRVPSGPFEIHATATAPYGRGSDSVSLNGIGPPTAPANEYRRLVEANVDIIPWAMEVTQAVRGPLDVQEPGSIETDVFNHVARKKTVVRGYGVHRLGADVDLRGGNLNADAVLHGTRGGVTLPLSPLQPSNSHVPLPAKEPGPEVEEVQRASTALTWNFELPLEWTQGPPIELRLEVNPETSPWHVEELPDVAGADNVIGRRVTFTELGVVGVSALNVELHWRCTRAMVSSSMSPCLGRTPRSRISSVLDYADIVSTLRDLWRMWPAPGSDPNYLRIRDISLPHAPDDDLSVSETSSRRLFGISWSKWRDAYHDLYCDGTPAYWDAIGTATTRDMLWMTNPPGSPIGVGGCAWLGSETGFLAAAVPGTVAQEYGHGVGLLHTSAAHGERFGGDAVVRFPGDHGQLGPPESSDWGFDTIAGVVIDPRSDGGDGHVHDFMSYGSGPKWISVGIWKHLFRSFVNDESYDDTRGRVLGERERRSAAAAQPDTGGQAWLINGLIDDDGSVTIGPPRLSDPGSVVAIPGDEVAVVLSGADGTELHRVEVATTTVHTHGSGGGRSFAALVPVSPAARTLEIEVDGKVAIRKVGAGNPVSITDLRTDGDRLLIAWDSGGSGESAIVEVQHGDEGWWPIGYTEDSSIDIDLRSLNFAGTGWKLRVQSSDGVTVASDERDVEFDQPDPVSVIASPSPGERIVEGMATVVAGVDVIGDSSAVYTWLVDGEVMNLGRVASVPISRGERTLTLRVENEGNVAESSVRILGVVDSDNDGFDDDWEDLHGYDMWEFDDPSSDRDQDGLLDGYEYELSADPQESDTDQDGFSDGEEKAAGSDLLDAAVIPGPIHGFDDHDHRTHDHGTGLALWIGLGAAALIGIVGGGLLIRRRAATR